MHRHSPPLESPLARLEACLNEVGLRPERRALCAGLLEFLRLGLLVYEQCRTTSGPRMAYTAKGNVLESVKDILLDAEHDRITYALLHSVATSTVVFVVNSSRGKLDIAFSGTAARFGLIHLKTDEPS
jgi:hypothetical protein